MTENQAITELENPPDIVTSLYPRFADACAMGAAALRRDGRGRGGDLAALYKRHLDFIYDETGAKNPEEVVEMANDGGRK